MVNGLSPSNIPYQGFPANAVGATPVTKDIASYCYDTQRTNIAKTYHHLTSEDKQSYTWPIIGAVVSFYHCLPLHQSNAANPNIQLVCNKAQEIQKGS